MNQQPPHSQKLSPPRTNGRIFIKIVLYFVGFAIAWFGFFGGIVTATGSSSPIGCFAFSFSLLALIASLFIFFQKKYYLHCLPWLQYLWWVLGITVGSIIVFPIIIGLTMPISNHVGSALFASMLFFYGVSLMWIAHLKPSLTQQVNESVYRILQARPGKQISVSDLSARLQGEYKQLGTTIPQHLGNLAYIELVNIPGAPEMICRIKPQQPAFTGSPMTPAPIHTSRPQPGPTPFRSPMSLNQSAQAPANPPKDQKPQDANVSLADQETVPALPIPIPNQKPATPPVHKPAVPPVQTPPIQPIPLSSKSIDTPMSPPNQTVPSAPLASQSPASSSSVRKEQKAIRIFCCYAHEDEQLLDKLKTHLKPQQRQGLIHIWHDRDILAGGEWEQEIEEQLNIAQVILLLVSPDFIASDYCYTKEMLRVLERHRRGEARAVPIILKPVDWRITPLGKLQALPKDGKPITTWANRDNAYLDAAIGIRNIVISFLTPPQQSKQQVQTLANPQRVEKEIELISTRCTQGKLIITNRKIIIQLAAFGNVLKSQILQRTALTSIDSKLVVPSVLGMGGGVNLTFHGKGRELLKADLVAPKAAKEILTLLS
jgi:hypothetical protein